MRFLDKKFFVLGLFIVISFLVYGNSIKGDFVHDDIFFTQRQELRSASALIDVWSEPMLPRYERLGTYRPVATATFVINFLFFGESPVSFHILNIILNGVASFVLYLFILKVSKSVPLSIFSSLIFMAMPIHTEVVANIKSRDEILAAIFIFTSWLFFIRASDSNESADKILNITIGTFSFYLAIASKETSLFAGFAILPILYFKKKILIKDLLPYATSLLLISLTALVIRYRILGKWAFGEDVLSFISNPMKLATVEQQFLMPFRIFFSYISNILFPINLSATYHYNHIKLPLSYLHADIIIGFILSLALIYLVFSKKTNSSPLGIGSLIFIFSYFPFSRIIFTGGGDMMAERWMYIPSAGIAIIIGFFFYFIFKNYRFFSTLIFLILIFSFSWVTISRNRIWLSAEALATSMLNDAPDSVMGYYKVSSIKISSKKFKEAEDIIMAGLRINPYDNMLWDNLAIVFINNKEYKKARDISASIISDNPSFIPSYLNLARSEYFLKNYQETVNSYDKILKSNYSQWTQPDIIYYADSLLRTGEYQGVIDLLINKKMAQNRYQQEADIIISAAFYKLGRIDLAEQFLSSVPGESLPAKKKFLSDRLKTDPLLIE